MKIDEERIKGHLDRIVRGTVEETLNNLLDAEADRLVGGDCYARSDQRRDYRSGHYERKLHTKAGEVKLKVPKLRRQTLDTAIIERYRRRESSVEEALMEMYLAGVSVRRVEDITEALWGTLVMAEATIIAPSDELVELHLKLSAAAKFAEAHLGTLETLPRIRVPKYTSDKN